MAISTLQAESVLANNCSDTIAALFSQWVESVRTYAAHPGDGDNPEWCELLDQSHDAAARLMQVPAQTIEDMAIKAYIAVRHEMGCTGSEFDIDFDGGLMTDATPQRALISDALRLSPTLRGLVSGAMGAA